jgi:hypothetical protein
MPMPPVGSHRHVIQPELLQPKLLQTKLIQMFSKQLIPKNSFKNKSQVSGELAGSRCPGAGALVV